MQVRDWLYVEDHCKAIDMVANGGKVGEVYNVGGHNERPNIFIVKTIISQLHDRLQDEGISEDLIKHVADRLGHDRRYGIDPTKIKNDLGWYPETPFEKGIVLTIDWYLNHQEWMDHVTSGDYQNYYQAVSYTHLCGSCAACCVIFPSGALRGNIKNRTAFPEICPEGPFFLAFCVN